MFFNTALESITEQWHTNIMHVSLRFILKNTESFLNYTATDRIGIIILIHQKFTEDDYKKTEEWTSNLIQ